jgi:dimethylaniline monooxygenase (N-oxide forming)
MAPPKKVLVIGAGAGGLVTLKTILEASQQDPKHPLDPILVEAEDEIGGTFRYEDLPFR